MARLAARIKRLEALDHARAGDELAQLSDAELDARICEVMERLTAQWREMLRDGMSVAELMAEIGRSADNPLIASSLVEAQAPAFNAARFLAALKGQLASAGAPDVPR